MFLWTPVAVEGAVMTFCMCFCNLLISESMCLLWVLSLIQIRLLYHTVYYWTLPMPLGIRFRICKLFSLCVTELNNGFGKCGFFMGLCHVWVSTVFKCISVMFAVSLWKPGIRIYFLDLVCVCVCVCMCVRACVCVCVCVHACVWTGTTLDHYHKALSALCTLAVCGLYRKIHAIFII